MIITNFEEYVKAKERFASLNEMIDAIFAENGFFCKIPDEITIEFDRILKAMDKFKKAYPFEVVVASEPHCYKEIGRFATLDEAMNECPKNGAMVRNSVTSAIEYIGKNFFR